MEAGTAAERAPGRFLPTWLYGVLPLAVIGLAVVAVVILGAPGLSERRGPPIEEINVEKTVLTPGQIELQIRNDGPDSVRVAQVIVNDSFVNFTPISESLSRLSSGRLKISYPWIEGEAYEIALVTSSGATIDHEIAAAVETPKTDLSFFALLALLGIYVGIVPVSIGMLWLPFLRRSGPQILRFVIAVTVGLLAFLAIDATVEGIELAGSGSQSLGGTTLVFLGAALAYLVLAGIDSHMSSRRESSVKSGVSGSHLALLVAIGIGLHNLGEGLAIGSAYAVGALALGAFLIVGFALHNTTEGLAIVAPMSGSKPSLARLAGLSAVAGGPAVLGTWIGAAAFNNSIAALLLGFGVGAIIHVIGQISPLVRAGNGRLLYPLSVAGILVGMAVLYMTGLIVSV